jgi:hypothetical protein
MRRTASSASGEITLVVLVGLDAHFLQAPMFRNRLLGLSLAARSVTSGRTVQLGIGHSHHMFGDAVCFLLIFVAGLIDRQFCLHRSCYGGI